MNKETNTLKENCIDLRHDDCLKTLSLFSQGGEFGQRHDPQGVTLTTQASSDIAQAIKEWEP